MGRRVEKGRNEGGGKGGVEERIEERGERRGRRSQSMVGGYGPAANPQIQQVDVNILSQHT